MGWWERQNLAADHELSVDSERFSSNLHCQAIGFFRYGKPHERINTYPAIFGIYVGEVLRKNYASDFKWESMEHGFGLRKENNVVFPIAKAYKHIQNGVEGF